MSDHGDAERGASEWVDTLARVLDDAVRVPGTNVRFGADAVVGWLLPVAGDTLTGVVGVLVLGAALRARVPTVVLARMVLNLAIDAVLGAVPVVGDVFVVAWKANRANVALLRAHAVAGGRPPGLADYAVVALGVLVAVAIVVLPLAVLAWAIHVLARR